MSGPEPETKSYIVNATLTFAGWVTVEATSPEEALAEAESIPASDFEYDSMTAEVDFNVTPAVEVWS